MILGFDSLKDKKCLKPLSNKALRHLWITWRVSTVFFPSVGKHPVFSRVPEFRAKKEFSFGLQ